MRDSLTYSAALLATALRCYGLPQGTGEEELLPCGEARYRPNEVGRTVGREKQKMLTDDI